MFNQPIILVDGSYLLHRTFHAVPPSYSDSGIMTNAIIGTVKHVVNLYNRELPEHMAIVVDDPAPSFRHKLSPAYKANRAPYPDEFLNQIPYTKELLTALGFNVVSIPGIEGDDLIGTLATFCANEGYHVRIMTADKDMAQLVNDSILLEDSFTRNSMDREGVFQKFGVYPHQIADMLALMGDKADGIAGVFGVGKVAAANLIWEYGGIEGMLANLEILPGTLGGRIRASVESLKLDRQLTGIVTDFDIGIRLDDLLIKPSDPDKLSSLCSELNISPYIF